MLLKQGEWLQVQMCSPLKISKYMVMSERKPQPSTFANAEKLRLSVNNITSSTGVTPPRRQMQE